MAGTTADRGLTIPAGSSIEVRPLTGHCGAEIEGLTLADPPDQLAEVLREPLFRYGVLVFRGQTGFTPAAQVALARCFGEVAALAAALPAGLPEQREVSRIWHGPDSPPTENIWHSDLSFLPDPPMGAVLRAVVVPPVGGDTLFADMRAAWRRLAPDLQRIVRTLKAEHNVAKHMPVAQRELCDDLPSTVHPVVRIHPETQEEILYVNPAYTTRVLGVTEQESKALLSHLFGQASVPEIQCRIRWTEGTVLLWDNRSTQHYAVADYLPAVRVMDRVAISEPH